MRRVAAVLAIALAATPAMAAREPLGLFTGWGAFRDTKPLRCYAIAEPIDGPAGARWRPFATIGHWPGRKIRAQFHIRLRAAKQLGAPVTLAIDDQHFPLVAGGADAWAPDARADAAIVAAIRGGSRMSVATTAEDGKRITDRYELRGAATAIDAAAIACARLG